MISSDYKHYKIKTSYANYYVAILKYQDKIYIGSKKKCLIISVYLDGDAPNIDSVCYDIGCNETATHLMRAGISFVKKHYSKYLKKHKIKLIYIMDKSSIQCERNYKQSLPYYYLAKYGQTWYEKHFKAIPDEIKTYEADKKRLKEALATKPKLKLKNKKLKKLYNNHENIGDFIKDITTTYDCIALKGWFNTFMVSYVPYLVGMRWKAFMKGNTIDIEIEKD